MYSITVGFSPTYNTVDPMLLPSGNPFECHEEVLSLQPMIPPKRFDIFPPDWEMLRRSIIDAFRFFFKKCYNFVLDPPGLEGRTINIPDRNSGFLVP